MFNIEMTLKMYGDAAMWCVFRLSNLFDAGPMLLKGRSPTHKWQFELMTFCQNFGVVFSLTFDTGKWTCVSAIHQYNSPVKCVFLDAVRTDLAQCRLEFCGMRLKQIKEEKNIETHLGDGFKSH